MYSSGQSPGRQRRSLRRGGSKLTKRVGERLLRGPRALREAAWVLAPNASAVSAEG